MKLRARAKAALVKRLREGREAARREMLRRLKKAREHVERGELGQFVSSVRGRKK